MGPLNIQANAVTYRVDRYPLTKKKKEDRPRAEWPSHAIGIPAALRTVMAMIIPMGRAGTPEEAAGPVLFLALPL